MGELQVETKASSQSKVAKMRILTLEATIAELHWTIEELRARILELEAALDAKQGELEDSLCRESVLCRDIESLKAQNKQQRSLLSSTEEQHKYIMATKNGQLDQLQVLWLSAGLSGLLD